MSEDINWKDAFDSLAIAYDLSIRDDRKQTARIRELEAQIAALKRIIVDIDRERLEYRQYLRWISNAKPSSYQQFLANKALDELHAPDSNGAIGGGG